MRQSDGQRYCGKPNDCKNYAELKKFHVLKSRVRLFFVFKLNVLIGELAAAKYGGKHIFLSKTAGQVPSVAFSLRFF